ncbi:MAG: ketopantoate reductase family protein [Alphaproteobacteria bacterium]|jgi:2-dehydropantoate 2-reductase
MTFDNPRILVVGAGAVGAYVGGNLAKQGLDVSFFDAWPAHVDKMRADGITLEGTTPEECFNVPVKAYHLTELQGLKREKPIDIAFICVKSYDTAWATMLVKDYLAPDGCVVSLQNCMNEETIANIVGWERTLGCIAAKIVVELVGPGHVIRRIAKGGAAHTVFRAGETSGKITPRLEQLVGWLSQIDSAKATTNLEGERWSKLVANAMGNGVSASTGMSIKEYMVHEPARHLSIRVAGEAVKVGQALGYSLEDINGFAPEIWIKAGEELESGANEAPNFQKVEGKLLDNAAKAKEGARPSMGQDMMKGRRTEIEFINGLVADKGKEIGIATPANVKLVAAVQSVEQGQQPAGIERLM